MSLRFSGRESWRLGSTEGCGGLRSGEAPVRKAGRTRRGQKGWREECRETNHDVARVSGDASRLVWLEPSDYLLIIRRSEFGNIQKDILLYQFGSFQLYLTENATKPGLNSYGNDWLMFGKSPQVWQASDKVQSRVQRPQPEPCISAFPLFFRRRRHPKPTSLALSRMLNDRFAKDII